MKTSEILTIGTSQGKQVITWHRLIDRRRMVKHTYRFETLRQYLRARARILPLTRPGMDRWHLTGFDEYLPKEP